MTRSRPSAADVLVVGDGVVAWACALQLAATGRRVTVLGSGDPSASAAAAGMIAPASEAVLDHADPESAALWRRAAAAWTPLAEALRLPLRREGALHLAPPEVLERRAARARALGFAAAMTGHGLLLADDLSLEPAEALRRLRAAAEAQGARPRRGRARVVGGRICVDDRPIDAPRTVVAAGWGAAELAASAPELAALKPIRGQLLQVAGPATPGPVVRAPGAYLVPQPWGWALGATMEPGRTDLDADPAAAAAILAAAAAVRPELAGAAFTPRVGVRAAVADGAPLVGPSVTPGVLLAAGMRRNGWLLAPLVAQVIAAYECGDPDAVLGGQAQAWAPARVLQAP